MQDNDDGPCTDCDDTGITIQTERRCACQPVEVKEPTIADLIESRLLGVHPDDQDLALDDADWLTILAALRARKVPEGVKSEAESDGWESGMRDAANICGSLAETTYDDADAFEAATGCEAQIVENLRMHQRHRAAIRAMEPPHKWPLGTRLRKKSGSSWNGRVVGYYSTDLTPDGVCVESEREPGSVQIYPVRAMENNDAGN